MTSADPASGPTETQSVFQVRGMTCQNCARHVREAILQVTPVSSVEIDLEADLARVRWRDGTRQQIDEVLAAVKPTGFDIALIQSEGQENPAATPWFNDWRTSVWLAIPALVFLLCSKWLFGWDEAPWFRWLSFGLASIVQIVCGSRFYLGAWRQLQHGRSNMDTLVSLGSTTAYVYSAAMLFSESPVHLYFKESIGIIAFVSIGHWIESRVAKRASSALESLLALAPSTATLLDKSGKKNTVALSELQPGQQIIVAPGEQIPVDGLVVAGNSSCDESMLTGESNPIDKSTSSNAYAGTVNLSGELTIKISGLGNDTALARIIAVVERAQSSRADVQKLADRISSVFVPIVVLVAIATFFAWIWLPAATQSLHAVMTTLLWSPVLPATATAAGVIHAAAVLIIACPCAMGLATPIAIMAGTNVAAKHGVLIRDGHALERSGQVTHVLFDKTGTLTQGTPEVAASHWADLSSNEKQEAIQILVALASRSKHPLSQSITKAFAEQRPLNDMTFDSWLENSGHGIEATLHGAPSKQNATWRLGSLKWLESNQIISLDIESFVSEQRSLGATIVGLANGQKLLGTFALRDQLKPGAKTMIHSLRGMGVEIAMVSGDHPQTANAIASDLGLNTAAVHAGVSPERKAAVVEKLQQAGRSVCFVGDGINDAPALEQADLGIAVRAASDIAKESADLVLLQSDVQVIPKALNMARSTLGTIKQNLFWAFFYNAVGIPLAALGFLSPILCAAAMGLSDLVVVGNALRLRLRRF